MQDYFCLAIEAEERVTILILCGEEWAPVCHYYSRFYAGRRYVSLNPSPHPGTIVLTVQFYRYEWYDVGLFNGFSESWCKRSWPEWWIVAIHLVLQKLQHCVRPKGRFHHPHVFVAVESISPKHGHFESGDLGLRILNSCSYNMDRFVIICRWGLAVLRKPCRKRTIADTRG